MVYKYYNITNITEGGNNPLVELFRTTSQLTNYLPGLLFLIAVFIVIFFSLKMRGQTTWGSFTVSAFLNFILAVLGYAIQIIPGWWLVLSIVMLPIGFLGLYVTEN